MMIALAIFLHLSWGLSWVGLISYIEHEHEHGSSVETAIGRGPVAFVYYSVMKIRNICQ